MKKLNLSLFFKEALLFLMTQLIGIWVVSNFQKYLIIAPESIGGSGLKWSNFSSFALIDVLLFVLVISAVSLLIRFVARRTGFFYKFFLAIAVFVGAQTVLVVLLGNVLSLFISVSLVYLMFRARNVLVQDIAVVLGIAGISASVGYVFSPAVAAVLLVALSVYDIIAVYKTKHMIEMAHQMIKSEAILGFLIPQKWADFNSTTNINLSQNKLMILGSGDVALPLILSASVARISLVDSLIVVWFSLAGLFLMHLIFINQKKKAPMAALPPIATLTILGYLFTVLVGL